MIWPQPLAGDLISYLIGYSRYLFRYQRCALQQRVVELDKMETRVTQSEPAIKKSKLSIAHLLRPHWKALTIAFIAVVGESLTDVLEPWPLKIVFDYVLDSKKAPVWLEDLIRSTVGHDKFAILNFAALA